MITHKTYKKENGEWVMPNEIAIVDKNIIHIQSKEKIIEGPTEKMSKSKKNVIEPSEILDNFGIDATRIFMVSDSPPDRELEWTDEEYKVLKKFNESINILRKMEQKFH